ncbi:protein-L-isoaspartate(D-aspartate) O-methyltransferase [Paraperlucidibaca baekdonensis]|uniref:Protein-L-isoaspartate O-methyltransferase n=1 Tax=Paraperlucidibaca baekdonensis TaxID=748120 RepID=A0A3E0H2T1_9GAMM|nr:protein-L-isoaspartate(D-aspartate) O-methyltransferase [Paraperlucidibaca baekdonensis]REH37618.1 protein-L-isoaspartate(D-aspartate) O-methyltransferase [Paraperlucidibaca baekdonensis]
MSGTFDLTGSGFTSARTRDRLMARLMTQGISDPHVLDVMRQTPRHVFVDEALAHRAYEDTALPIGHSQTLSQPYIVARMSEILLAAGARQKVLEIGTGSGYQTAVLAQLVGTVHSIERIKALQDKARERLKAMGLNNVRLRHADGMQGWPGEGEYDGIIGTAAALGVPPALIDLLAIGGRMVLPVGAGQRQSLVLVCKTADGVSQEIIEPVHFVPMLGGVVG